MKHLETGPHHVNMLQVSLVQALTTCSACQSWHKLASAVQLGIVQRSQAGPVRTHTDTRWQQWQPDGVFVKVGTLCMRFSGSRHSITATFKYMTGSGRGVRFKTDRIFTSNHGSRCSGR